MKLVRNEDVSWIEGEGYRKKILLRGQDVNQDGGLGSGPINLAELVGMNLFGYEAQSCRKPSGFQRFATMLPGKFTLS